MVRGAGRPTPRATAGARPPRRCCTKGRLYIVNDNDEESSLTVFEAATGKEIWRVARDEKSNWATPFLWEHDGRTEIVTPGTNKVRSYDLDGKLLWELGGMSSIVIPTPFTAHGLLYIDLRLRRRRDAPGLRNPARRRAATSA